MIARTPPDCCVADYSSLVDITNADIARHLNEIAELLEAQRANPFRVQAYRNAADTLLGLHQSAQQIFEDEGLAGLTELPGIGRSLAAVVEQRIRTGHSSVLDRLRGDARAERLFGTVPGIGPELAARIHEQLGIDTLQQLELAAHNGSLLRVPGMGQRRVLAVRESLAGRFRHGPYDADALFDIMSPDGPTHDHVTVAVLLDVDEEYRRRAAAGELVQIAPKRFNTDGDAWLPILHTERHDQHFTALFSNSARAHQLGRTHDWVIIHHDDESDGQWTVVTEHRGSLKGKRIVRGRERECVRHYSRPDAPGSQHHRS
ncbi:MAG: helix-hairpin-helix domain-containing protein [Fuerstiella sp.]